MTPITLTSRITDEVSERSITITGVDATLEIHGEDMHHGSERCKGVLGGILAHSGSNTRYGAAYQFVIDLRSVGINAGCSNDLRFMPRG